MNTNTLDFKPMPARLVGERERRIERGKNALSFHISFLDDYLKGIATNDLILLGAPTGLGKCLAPNTLVLRYDGRIVRADEVVVGDDLMGPDSKPRRVQSTTTGTGPLFEIQPTKGDPWTCNDVHVLTLVHTTTGTIVDVPLDEYLRKNPTWKHEHKLFATGVDFVPQETLPIDPYFLGLWFGDGSKTVGGNGLLRVMMTTQDAEVVAACEAMAQRFGLVVQPDLYEGKCPSYRIVNVRGAGNPLLDLMRAVLGDSLRVPTRYLTASRADRLAFLAGWLDSDGYLAGGCFEFVQKRGDWADAVTYLARSVGLRVTERAKVVDGESYVRLHILGNIDAIPTKLPRKKAEPRRQRKDALRCGFDVESLGDGDYVGFTLDGDGRFLLGDFTVTHNTDLALSIAAASALRGKRVHYYALEAEQAELELRTKYALISKRAYELRLPNAHELNYSDWFFGRSEHVVGDLDAWADDLMRKQFRTLNTGYRGNKFDTRDLAESLIEIHQDTDLVVVDHLHYVDNDSDDEQRALGDTVKVLRDITVGTGIPIICVAHLRKKNPNLKQIIPTVDDFHGSSNITKICTQVITIERADDVEAAKWFLSPTYMAILKDRRGGKPRTVALMNFDTRTKRYTPQYTLGLIAGPKWKEIPLTDVPRWAQGHVPLNSEGAPSQQTQMQVSR